MSTTFCRSTSSDVVLLDGDFHPLTTDRIIGCTIEVSHARAFQCHHTAYHHSILPLATDTTKERNPMGYRRLQAPFWVFAEDVAGGNRSRYRDLRGFGRMWDSICGLGTQTSQTVEEDGVWIDERDDCRYFKAIPLRVAVFTEIALFFYEPQLAMDVAFRGALNNGVNFASTIEQRALALENNRLLHFATDGESYGHHHRHGEVALGFCLDRLQSSKVEITNYGAYLAKHPPTQQAKIVERSSWSCAHGVGRWSENCGCVIDPAMKGQQEWRADLRSVLNRLGDITRTLFMDRCVLLLTDPMEVRHRWKEAVLSNTVEALIQEFTLPKIDVTKKHIETVQFWMDQQELALKMFTSCGWFFDSYTGIEAQQILAYAQELIKHTSSESIGHLHKPL